MSTSAPSRVLAVCLGNICRSPMAEGLLRHHVQTKGLLVKVDSAGTNGYHNGEAPDSRAQAEMRRHGIEIAAQESRQIKKKDFEKYDLILVMGHGKLLELGPPTNLLDNPDSHLAQMVEHLGDSAAEVSWRREV